MNTKISIEMFADELFVIIDELYNSQHENIKKTAELCAEAIANGGVIQVMGSGHSIGFGMEMCNRAGTLVPINNIKMQDFVIKGKVSYEEFKDPKDHFERKPGVADKLYDLYDIKPEDIFIIISNSGINGVVIDLALHAKKMNHKVIVVTSWQHTSTEASRHPSGKKLYQIGDVVIDNCGPQGDALIATDGPEKICSISSITGAYIAQTIGTEVCETLITKGVDLPVLWSIKQENHLEHNQELLKKYEGRIG